MAIWVKPPSAPHQKPRAIARAWPAPPGDRTCRGRTASAPCRSPAPTDPRPPPHRTRPHPALAPRRGRAACSQGRGPEGANRGDAGAAGEHPSPRTLELPPRPGRGLTYLRRISPPRWGSTWPGRARPRGRGGRATARRGRRRARLWRTARRGGGGQAARGSGRRISHRPSRMPPPPPPRPDRDAFAGGPAAPGAAGRRKKARHLSVPRRRSVSHSSAARLPAPPRLGSPQRARKTPAHAPLPGARGLAPPGLAPPEPARRSTRRRAPTEGNRREEIGPPGPGQVRPLGDCAGRWEDRASERRAPRKHPAKHTHARTRTFRFQRFLPSAPR